MKVPSARLAWIASKSLVNCHAEGVDSLLFDDTPGEVVRAFVATPTHTLWRNTWGQEFSVGFHPHHCKIELSAAVGAPRNVTMEPGGSGRGGVGEMFYGYRYESPIRGGSGHFTRTLLEVRILPIHTPFGRIAMSAQAFHTIFVPAGEMAAWFVHEGDEDPYYQPLCVSNSDLTQFDASKLYQPMTVKQVVQHCTTLGVEIVE